jgi:hypothetical protein
MISKTSLGFVPLVLLAASSIFGQGLWHPGSSGTAMTDNVYKVDGSHRKVLWTIRAGYEMSIDGAATYDNWRSTDEAPQVRISFNDTSVDLGDRDFVITGRTRLQPGYGDTVPAPVFKYELSGVEILIRLFINDDGSAHDPNDTKYYHIHATSRASETADCYSPINNYRWIVSKLENEAGHPNLVLVAPRFLRDDCAAHPYGLSWGYQYLRAEEDRILLDIHEDFTRTRFPAVTGGADEKFFLSGNSGGGQFVVWFIMGHSDKLKRVVASAPWGTAHPSDEYEWIYGTHLPFDFS